MPKLKERLYMDDMRQRMGLEEGDRRRDEEIEKMTPRQRFALLCGWHLGDSGWASTVLDWAEDAGLKITE